MVGDGLLSVVMPAFNLGGVIADNVRDVRTALSGSVRFEIIVVDDGSTDNTRSQLDAARKEIPELKTVFLPRNSGKGVALKTGFEASSGTLVLFLDADLDLPPAQIMGFFAVMEEKNADIVIGSKMHPRSDLSYPWRRRLTSTVYYLLVKAMFGLPTRDTQTGIKLFRRAALEWAMPRLLVKQFAFDLELLAVAHEKGFIIADSPVVLRFRGHWGWVRPSAVMQILTDTFAVFYRIQILHYYKSIPSIVPPTPLPTVSVVVACPRWSPALEECLDAVGRQTIRPLEVLILPDEPTGKSLPQNAVEIPTGRLRPAEKRNLGINRATGDLVAFIDDDACPTEDWIQRAVVYFSDRTIAAVGGPGVSPASDSLACAASGRIFSNPLVSGQHRSRYTPTRVMQVDDLPSCNLVVRRDVLQKLGGFNTRYWPGEDTILCRDITKTYGLSIIYDPRVLVFHHRRPVFLPHLRQVARYATHRGFFARRFPETSRRITYMLPSALVGAGYFGGILALLLPVLAPFYLAAAAAYLFLAFAASFHRRFPLWMMTWIGIPLTHLTYGVRFVVGLCTSKLPSEAAEFDHSSEEKVKGSIA